MTSLPEELKPFSDAVNASEQEFIKININPVETPLPVTSSKFGGKPFVSKKYGYPKASDGSDLLLIAQINFKETPKLKDFPESGLLQFFISNNDLLGLNFDDQIVQEGFRLIYMPENELTQDNIDTTAEIPVPDRNFVMSEEFALTFSLDKMPVTMGDFRFNVVPREAFRSNDKLYKAYDEAVKATGHRMGGYPFFTQEDPRRSAKYREYTTLLLQLDSEQKKASKQYSIIWGDVGVCNFFIKPDKLRNLDFSDVIYNWDCY